MSLDPFIKFLDFTGFFRLLSGSQPIGGSVTEAVTRGKVARKYYETTVSAFMMIWDSDAEGGLRLRSPLLKSSDLNWSRN